MITVIIIVTELVFLEGHLVKTVRSMCQSIGMGTVWIKCRSHYSKKTLSLIFF